MEAEQKQINPDVLEFYETMKKKKEEIKQSIFNSTVSNLLENWKERVSISIENNPDVKSMELGTVVIGIKISLNMLKNLVIVLRQEVSPFTIQHVMTSSSMYTFTLHWDF